MQDWIEYEEVMADTPDEFRDQAYYSAIEEMKQKKKTCTCGLEETIKDLKQLKVFKQRNNI